MTEHESPDRSAEVMDAVAAGESSPITRHGVEIAELRPLGRRGRLSAEEPVTRHGRPPRVDGALPRSEADEFFGTEDRVGDAP
ncbi:PhdYeFM domain-containing protein [Streptomyces sp. cmx-18-6]|uniref:PhdYeFM domain-containing protein n=1 Tax=Streptomyces sp. cmx-18-6 TaxID=2790930 RepID=UPI0039808E0C